ncbi:MAG: NUDIX hydrolase [Thermoplasmata archaeon]
MSPPESNAPPSRHTRVSVGGVLIREGRVLVNRASYRTRFTIPGGFVERGESLEAALVREFEEETGVLVRPDRLFLARYEVANATESDAYYAFLVSYVSGEPAPRPPEIVEVRDPALDEALRADWISDASRFALRCALERGAGWARGSWQSRAEPPLFTEVYHR